MQPLEEIVCQISGATQCELGSVIQSLWSDYGAIYRANLRGDHVRQVIIKHVDLSESRENARGWSGAVSHQRKVRSYEVETNFYCDYSARCSKRSRIPGLIASNELADGRGRVLVLEDLDASGFHVRKRHAGLSEVKACLSWLANFHGTFMGASTDGLWQIGTYWHLATRPEELAAMENLELQQAAAAIDERLNAATYKTLVHGDAKLANFCFTANPEAAVAAVDFQYVGGGCGMKDVAYLISCLDARDTEYNQSTYLDYYFDQLREVVQEQRPKIDANELETEWRELYDFAWADFCRFLNGWSPGHWKLNSVNDRLTRGVLGRLGRV